MRRVRYFLVIAAAAVAACGDDSDVDVAQVERDLAGVVESQSGTPEVSVTCPEDVAVDEVCEVEATGGVEAEIRVTRLGDRADGELVTP